MRIVVRNDVAACKHGQNLVFSFARQLSRLGVTNIFQNNLSERSAWCQPVHENCSEH